MTYWNTNKVLLIFPNGELRKVLDFKEHPQEGRPKPNLPSKGGHSFNNVFQFIPKCSNNSFQSVYCVPGTVLGFWNKLVDKTNKHLSLTEFTFKIDKE